MSRLSWSDNRLPAILRSLFFVQSHSLQADILTYSLSALYILRIYCLSHIHRDGLHPGLSPEQDPHLLLLPVLIPTQMLPQPPGSGKRLSEILHPVIPALLQHIHFQIQALSKYVLPEYFLFHEEDCKQSLILSPSLWSHPNGLPAFSILPYKHRQSHCRSPHKVLPP